MKRLIYKGGAGPERNYQRGLRRVTFVAGVAQDIEDDAFAAELLGQNPDGLTVEQAEPYSIPVFEEVGSIAPSKNVDLHGVREAGR